MTDQTSPETTPATSHAASDGTPDLSAVTVSVLGAGNMGGAFVRAMLAAGVAPQNLRVVNSSDASSRRAADELGATAGSLSDLSGSDVVVLGVKPYQLDAVMPEVRSALAEDTLVICLAAGTSLAALTKALGGHTQVVRAMPNTPMSVGEGVTHLMASDDATGSSVELARALLSAAGIVVDLPEEKGHAMIGAAGSASAFVFTVVDAMIDEAVRQGIPRPEATRVILQTVRGAATLLQETGQHPAVARSAVMSPGGTTAEGIAALERGGIRPALAGAMDAAARKSRAMSGE
ncbi:pyrroline-5-carboxylate reductase [Brachybacterium halotolerans subsp. kimchii]|uniref:pyrroline-5-carboxylate reductase n=1 Tax=Brachybacterium halotolerans TaxID=2795215 RepID=UPI001E519DCB|nr:pyrroline-5-carboxylate reductase [Brachybacterium halotolerans]UEJ82245.1 pyrroline-5-carboxylate reductase [Brachybacterium halotolerans subsp. kimchii]